MLALDRGQVHVWLAPPPSEAQADLLWRRESVLDSRERLQLHRFVFARDRLLYLTAHLAVRTTLSLYAQRAPAEWRFDRTVYGRPEFASATHGLRFNLSHTPGMVAIAIALIDDIGIDVENTVQRDPPLGIVDHYFAPAEVAALRSLSLAEQRDRFYDYWTLKEAYIKARGLGLALPLDQFAFEVEGMRPRIAFDARLDDDPGNWQFALLRTLASHRLAVALHATAALDIRVRGVSWSRLDEAVARA